MKRFFASLAPVYVAFMIAGCDGGLKEGMSTDPAPADGQPPGFKELMQGNDKQIYLKKQGPPKGGAAQKKGP